MGGSATHGMDGMMNPEMSGQGMAQACMQMMQGMGGGMRSPRPNEQRRHPHAPSGHE